MGAIQDQCKAWYFIARSNGKHNRSCNFKNRHYVKSVAEVLLLCSRQEIALRGHRESIESQNRGNFLELLTLVAKHDPIVQERISQGPRNATYTSPGIQNDMLRTMVGMVQDEICAAVNKAGFFFHTSR